METMASRRNHFHSTSRKADNTFHSRGANTVNNWNNSKPGFSPQRANYNTRQSLSRSCDSPEGIGRIIQPRSCSPLLRRSAISPTSVRKHNSSAIGRNQTILDDAAWMSERIQNLQKSGLLRYPSMSKLRDPSHILHSAQSFSVGNAECEETSPSCSSPFSQSSTPLQRQEAISYADEPLSAFRLSEVTLSEEDLLTDISSTCTSTPVSLKSGRVFDEMAADCYQGSHFSNNLESNYSYVADRDSEPSLKNSHSNNVRGDLLERLEALQYRAELATKASHSNTVDSNLEKQYFKDFADGQFLDCSKDSVPSNQNWNAVVQQSNALSGASPTHNVIQPTSWLEVPQNSSDSSCSLQAVKNEEVQAWSDISHLFHSSSRTIRPEYYLPLSKEEEPPLEAMSPLSSLSEARRSKLKDGNLRKLALVGTSPVSQLRSADVRAGKLSNSHKQTHQARRSRRSLESSRCSTSRSMMARTVVSTNGSSALKSCPVSAREAHSTEIVPSQGSLSNNFTNIKQEDESCNTNDCADFQIKNSSQAAVDYDGEVSWISEENVEGFLCSRCFAIDEVDVLNTSEQAFDMNDSSITGRISSSTANEKGSSETKDNMEVSLPLIEQSLSGPLEKGNGCSQDTTCRDMKESMEGLSMFDHCQAFLEFGSMTINNQTVSNCQLLETDCLAHSDENFLHHNSVESDLVVYCKTIHDNQQVNKDATTNEQLCCKDKLVSSGTVCCKDSDTEVIESQSATLETQQQAQSTYVLVPSHFDNSTTSMTKQMTSLDATMSSPEIFHSENQHLPVIARRYKKESPPLDQLEENLDTEHRRFARIARSLSFNEKATNELEGNPKQNTCNNPSELKSTSFSHYWIPNSAYSLDIAELLNNVKRTSSAADADSLLHQNLVGIPHSLKLQATTIAVENDLLKEVLSLPSGIGSSDMAKGHRDIDTIPSLPDESCMATSELIEEGVLANRLKTSQQCRQFQVENSGEIPYRLQDDSMVNHASKDEGSWQQPNDSNKVPKYGQSKTWIKLVDQETLTPEKDICTKAPSPCKNKPEETTDMIVKELNLLDECVSEASLNIQNKMLVPEGEMKCDTISKLSCTTGIQTPSSERRNTSSSSLLSVYKNPLWLDENNTDIDNDHMFQDQEFLNCTYGSEREVGFLNSDSNQISFSRRFKDKAWDTYEGMGAFISEFPSSPSHGKRGVSTSDDNLMGFVNCGDMNSLWVIESKAGKEIFEEDKDGHAIVCESQLSKDCSIFKGLLTCELSKLAEKQKLSTYGNSSQQKKLASAPDIVLESENTSHNYLSSSPAKVRNIVDNNYGICSNSSLLSCSERCLQWKEASTFHAKFSPHSARMCDSLDNCSSNRDLMPGSIESTTTIVANQDVELVAGESSKSNLLYGAPSIISTTEESGWPEDIPGKTEETGAGDTVEVNGDSRTLRSRRTPCASKKAVGASIQTPCVSRKALGTSTPELSCGVNQNNQVYEQNRRECIDLLDSGFRSVNATQLNESPNHPIMPSNDEMEAGEEVKRVTFVYSDPKRSPQKHVGATLPEVPVDLVSSWMSSSLSFATKESGNLKKREQKQPLIQDRCQEDKKDLKRIGKKVEALEAEIDKFKSENRKLRNLVKFMIRKMKQLQQGFRGRKRRATSKGFMTCIHAIRVPRSKSKTLKKT